MEKDKNWKPDYKNDVVYLHVLPRSYAGSIANISPFALKVETWLRITNIPFQVIDILCLILILVLIVRMMLKHAYQMLECYIKNNSSRKRIKNQRMSCNILCIPTFVL